MKAKKIDSNGNVLVQLEGDIDEYASRDIRVKLDDIIMNNRIRCMILDFENVNFVDSTGLGLILGRYKKLRSQGGELLVSNVNSNIDKVFRTSGIYSVAPKIDRGKYEK